MIYRPEIAGLRSIAVLSVIFYHAKFLAFEQIWSSVYFGSNTPHPGYQTLMPVVGTALIIVFSHSVIGWVECWAQSFWLAWVLFLTPPICGTFQYSLFLE